MLRVIGLRLTAHGLRSLLAATALVATAHAAVLDCEMNGQPVNPANGSTTAGKTGIMKCVDRETRKFQREEEYRDGKAMGYRKSVDFSGNVSVGSFNEQGNRHGEFKQYAPDGTLTSEERYANGSATGLQVFYHPNKQVRRRSFAEPPKGTLASIEYNDRGQVSQLRCADKPLLGDDRALCGFDGKVSEITFYNAKGEVSGQARFQNGQRLAITAYGKEGAVSQSEEVQGDKRVLRQHYPEGALKVETIVVGNTKLSERELAKSGQPVRETRWADGRMAEETQWYLNGQQKSRTRWERDGNQVLVKVDEFWDNGKLKARSVQDERRNYVGLQSRYAESGALESESSYEKGALARKRSYKDGKLVLDEEYFEDGSRKSTRKID